MRLFHFLALIFSCLFLSTCKKEENLVCTDANTNKPVQHAMDYFYFKKGTWWVYEKEGTLELDSIWIMNDTSYKENLVTQKRECKCGKGKCVISYSIKFANIQHKTNTNPLYVIGISSTLFEDKTIIGEDEGISFLGSGFRVEYENYNYKSPTEQGAILETLDSILIKGNTFKDIFHQYYPFTDNIPDWLHEAWYAKNIYLVRYKKYDGTVWNLVRWHIEK